MIRNNIKTKKVYFIYILFKKLNVYTTKFSKLRKIYTLTKTNYKLIQTILIKNTVGTQKLILKTKLKIPN